MSSSPVPTEAPETLEVPTSIEPISLETTSFTQDAIDSGVSVSETSVLVSETLASEASVIASVPSEADDTSQNTTLHAPALSSASSTSTSLDASDNAATDMTPRSFETHIYMSDYDCDLDFSVKGSEVSTRTDGGFCYLWSGGRASHGVFRGKFGYQVKILEDSPLPSGVPPGGAHKSHICRLGWSILSSPVSRLGEVPQSYGFGGTGMKSTGGQFLKYGSQFGAGDIITCLADFDQKTISYALNGKLLPVAFNGISGPLFPHLLLKNVRCEVDFFNGFLPPGYKALAEATSNELQLGPLAPTSQQECEVIMLVGLPQCGKTSWARSKAAREPQKHWNILGTDLNIDKMKIENLHRDNNYHERWEQLIQLASDVFNTQLALAATMKRNFILDQTNVFKHARQRKLEPFHSFKKTAAVVCVNEAEHARRRDQSQKFDGKIIPDKAVADMIQGFVLPNASEKIFSRVEFIELNEYDSQALLMRLKANIHSGKRPFEVTLPSTPALPSQSFPIAPSLSGNQSFQPNKRPAPSYPIQRQDQYSRPDTYRTDPQISHDRSLYSRDSRSDLRVESRSSRPDSYSYSSRDSRGPAFYESRDHRPDARDPYSGKSDSRSSRADYGRDFSTGDDYSSGRSDSYDRYPSPADSHHPRDHRTEPHGPPTRGSSRDTYFIKKEEPTDYTNQNRFPLPPRQSSREFERSVRGDNYAHAEPHIPAPASQRRDTEHSKSTPYSSNFYASDSNSTYSTGSTSYYEQAVPSPQFYKQEPTDSQPHAYSQPSNYRQPASHFSTPSYSQSAPSQTPAHYSGMAPTYAPSLNYSQSNPQHHSNFSYSGYSHDTRYGQSQATVSISGSYSQGTSVGYYAGVSNFSLNAPAAHYSSAARPLYPQQYQQR